MLEGTLVADVSRAMEGKQPTDTIEVLRDGDTLALTGQIDVLAGTRDV